MTTSNPPTSLAKLVRGPNAVPFKLKPATPMCVRKTNTRAPAFFAAERSFIAAFTGSFGTIPQKLPGNTRHGCLRVGDPDHHKSAASGGAGG